MTPTDFGPFGTLMLAQATPAASAPPEAAAAPAAQAAPSNQPGFTVPGATGTAVTTQTPGVPGATGAGGQGGAVSPFGNPMLLLALFAVMVLLLPALTGRKEKKRRQELLSGLKRGDRVQTTAGIVGTIADLSDTEMTLRVDEASNTRIRFSRASVQAVVKEGKEAGRADVEVKPKSQAPATT
jgi:preprotein translocase subunit YajC